MIVRLATATTIAVLAISIGQSLIAPDAGNIPMLAFVLAAPVLLAGIAREART